MTGPLITSGSLLLQWWKYGCFSSQKFGILTLLATGPTIPTNAYNNQNTLWRMPDISGVRGCLHLDIGLVLEGGGGKGAYQIGAWQAIRELGIEEHIKVVSGTSVGALNAALFLTEDIELAKEIWFNISHGQLLTDMGRSDDSFFTNYGLTRFIDSVLARKNQKGILCYATAKNVDTGEVKYFRLHGLIDPGYKRNILLASSAMPSIFPMVKIDGAYYTDGGANGDNIPIKPVYDNKVPIIIVVRLSQDAIANTWPDVRIIEITPSQPLGGMLSGTLDFSQEGARQRFELGYYDAKEQLSELARQLSSPSPRTSTSSGSVYESPLASRKKTYTMRKQEETKNMDKIIFKNPELQKQYDERIKELQKIAQSPALTQERLWDATVAKYAETIARVRRIISQTELSPDIPERLDKQLRTFLEKCMNPEFHIALVGAIKAGKSSLINAMLGEELASTEVTPETAALTKFQRSSKKDYIAVSFYNDAEWDALWKSASGVEDSKFMREYRNLKAEEEKKQWVGHPDIQVECDTKAELKETIRKWTSSQSATHYFVKEVVVGLNEFDFPEGVILVDTPGLNDAVAYRSEITKNYIDRANAVLVCVKADNLTGSELSTICGVFSNARYNPEKVFIIATQQDSLNDPIEDWKKQRDVWMGHLKEKICYGSEALARKNLIPTSGYFYTLLTNLEQLDQKRRFQLYASAMKLEYTPENITGNLDFLLDFTGISLLKRTIDQEIVARYRELLLEDIKSNYDASKEAVADVLQKIRDNQKNLVDISTKSLDELAAAQQENAKKLEEAKSDQRELEELVAEVQKQTDERTKNLVAAIRRLGR